MCFGLNTILSYSKVSTRSKENFDSKETAFIFSKPVPKSISYIKEKTKSISHKKVISSNNYLIAEEYHPKKITITTTKKYEKATRMLKGKDL